jgi:hypothetical protein
MAASLSYSSTWRVTLRPACLGGLPSTFLKRPLKERLGPWGVLSRLWASCASKSCSARSLRSPRAIMLTSLVANPIYEKSCCMKDGMSVCKRSRKSLLLCFDDPLRETRAFRTHAILTLPTKLLVMIARGECHSSFQSVRDFNSSTISSNL